MSTETPETAPTSAAPVKTVKIFLTDRPPIRIVADDWPVIASEKDWDNQYECQANRTWHLKLRQHADGRIIVYGWKTSQFQDENELKAGEILATGEDIAAAIHRVAANCDCESLADGCIQDLPAEEVNGALPARPLPQSIRDLSAIKTALEDLTEQLHRLAASL